MSHTIVDSIHARIANRRLLDHPFYTAWSNGELSIEDLRQYAAQYYHWVHAFPTWLSAAHANADDLQTRQVILENLIDEERGPENHPELWLRFCDALGIDRAAVRNAALAPETTAAIERVARLVRNTSTVAAIAALYAYESQQPEVMKTKQQGLRDLYGVAAGHAYFEVHEALDVEHSAGERAILERLGPGAEAEIDAAVQIALDATYTLLDGTMRLRGAISSPRACASPSAHPASGR